MFGFVTLYLVLSLSSVDPGWAKTAVYEGKQPNLDNLNDVDEIGNQYTEADEMVSAEQDCATCNLRAALGRLPVNQQDPTCEDRHKKLFSKKEMHFTMDFGLEDNIPLQPYTMDRVARAAFERALQQKCTRPNQNLCGFQKEPYDKIYPGVDPEAWPESFQKMFQGPDGQSHMVHFNVMNSSATSFMNKMDSKYRGLLKSDKGSDPSDGSMQKQQMAQSQLAEDTLIKNACENDGLFYVGHGRGGAGPGFFPPEIKNNYYDFSAELKEHDTLTLLAKQLSKCKRDGPKFIALHSCAYVRTQKALVKAAPEATLQTTATFGFPQDDAFHVYGTLNALLGTYPQYCEPELTNAANPKGKTVHLDPRSRVISDIPAGDGHPREAFDSLAPRVGN